MKQHNWISTERVIVSNSTDPIGGVIKWDVVKSLWYFFHMIIAVSALFFVPRLDTVMMFFIFTAITICAGHSVGMHRLLIHRSFKTPLWVEHILVYLGTLVSMQGPFGMIRLHDMRDWHQRQVVCPPHPSHSRNFLKDAWWQLHCKFALKNPPRFVLETHVERDPFYRFIQATWMLQQLPVALALYLLGGAEWVIWGISLRIWISLTMHWLVGHLAHTRGQQTWKINGLPVQGYNIKGISILTFGENWHGNHHAFPHSAKLGEDNALDDIGFQFVRLLEWLDLAQDIQTEHSQPAREGLLACAKT